MESQRIVLFGATSQVGERILKEALNRGHRVTVIDKDPRKISTNHPNLQVIPGDIMNKHDMGSKIKGHDVVICVYENKNNPSEHLVQSKALIEALKTGGVKHLVTTGHPGTPDVDPSVIPPVNTEAWQNVAEAERKVIEALENERDFRWSYIHYPEIQEPFGKTGKPVLGNEMLVKNTDGEQRFSINDIAQTVLDEAEYYTTAHTAHSL